MTPKEKAYNIIEKMHNVDFHDLHDELAMQFKHAIKCALIAVDEILNALSDDRISYGSEYRYEVSDFYQMVKQEIEKL